MAVFVWPSIKEGNIHAVILGTLGLPFPLVDSDHFGAFFRACRLADKPGGDLESVIFPTDSESVRALKLMERSCLLPFPPLAWCFEARLFELSIRLSGPKWSGR